MGLDFRTAVAATVVFLVAIAPAHGATLPPKMAGLWKGSPRTCLFGPWQDTMGFAIQALSDGSGFVVGDYFRNTFFIPESHQRFWVQEGKGLTYCGHLAGGFVTPVNIPSFGNIQFPTMLVESTPTKSVFVGTAEYPYPWNVTYSFELEDDDTLTMTVVFEEAYHLDVTLSRVGDTTPFPVADSAPFPHPCNYTTPLLPGQASPPINQVPAPTPAPSPPPPHSVCYVLNRALDVRLSWTLDADAGTLSATISARPDAPSSSFLAVGFASEVTFPSMHELDVVAGFLAPSGGSCVQTLYAEEHFGPPVPSASLRVNATEVTTADGVLSVSFTRPLKSGHNPLAPLPPDSNPMEQPLVYWATGAVTTAGDDCAKAAIHYHGPNRGLHGAGWFNPDALWGEWEKCSAN